MRNVFPGLRAVCGSANACMAVFCIGFTGGLFRIKLLLRMKPWHSKMWLYQHSSLRRFHAWQKSRERGVNLLGADYFGAVPQEFHPQAVRAHPKHASRMRRACSCGGRGSALECSGETPRSPPLRALCNRLAPTCERARLGGQNPGAGARFECRTTSHCATAAASDETFRRAGRSQI